MTTIATAVGYIVIGMAVLLALATAAGKFFNRKQDYKLEFEDWDPAPRTLAPHVPPSWRLDDAPSDTTPHNPAP